MFRTQILTNPDVSSLSEYLERWNELMEEQPLNLYSLYQSPEWFAYLLQRERSGNNYLCIVRDGGGRIAGIVALSESIYYLDVRVKHNPVMNTPLKVIEVLGGSPSLRADENAYLSFVVAVQKKMNKCEAIYFKSLPEYSPAVQTLKSLRRKLRYYSVYFPFKQRPLHSLELPQTFEDYLTSFSSRSRNFFKRRIRQLRELDGDLHFHCIEAEDQVDMFMEAVRHVLSCSWKRDKYEVFRSIPAVADLRYLARKKILRGYVLRSEARVFAFVLGYKHQRVYHYSDLGYHEDMAKYSPGTSLLYLLIQDLIAKGDMDHLNFGIGDAEYKRKFGNTRINDCSLLVVKKTIYNDLCVKSHALLSTLHSTLKKTREAYLEISSKNGRKGQISLP